MLQRFICILLLISHLAGASAQNAGISFTATLSSDSVGLDEILELTFTLKDAKGSNFEAPDFPDFELVGGPNQSSSFSMRNGLTTQQISYTYYLAPKQPGQCSIAPASIIADGQTMTTDELVVTVLEGYESPKKPASKDAFGWGRFGEKPPKKEEETTKKSSKIRKVYKL